MASSSGPAPFFLVVESAREEPPMAIRKKRSSKPKADPDPEQEITAKLLGQSRDARIRKVVHRLEPGWPMRRVNEMVDAILRVL